MSGDVTITGGTNNGDVGSPPGYDLGFNVTDRAYVQAQAMANALNSTYGSVTTETFPSLGAPGGLVISPDQETGFEVLSGYNAIAIQDTANPQTVVGGGVANQTVVAGLGDLTFYADGTNAEDNSNIHIAAIGGDNFISMAGNNGNNTVYTSTGNDTALRGDGVDSFLLGAGNNSVMGGNGLTSVEVGGNDTMRLGLGSAIVYVDPLAPGATELIHGTSHTTVPTGAGSYNLVFINGSGASTVLGGGAGSYHILAGVGGGVYTGATGGNNDIVAGSGAVTLIGGGDNDFLQGGSGTNLIKAGNGGTVFVNSGSGAASIVSGSGRDYIQAIGADTIKLGHGFSLVDATGAPATVSALIQGASSVNTGSNYSLQFIGGAGAATILGGAGRYNIAAGSGGGEFHAGSAGFNNISGTGAMTIFGGGDGDYLQAGDSGNNVITAGSGTEVLSAGMGNATLIGNTNKADFSFQNIGTLAGAYTVEGFHAGDLTHFADAATASYALNHYDVSRGASGTSNSKWLRRGVGFALA